MGYDIKCLAKVQSHEVSLLSSVNNFCLVINCGHKLGLMRNYTGNHVDVE